MVPPNSRVRGVGGSREKSVCARVCMWMHAYVHESAGMQMRDKECVSQEMFHEALESKIALPVQVSREEGKADN